jgi:hypothetical protein
LNRAGGRNTTFTNTTFTWRTPAADNKKPGDHAGLLLLPQTGR